MSFIGEEYLLESPPARRLYDEIRGLPILDPHSHVDVDELAANDNYDDIWEVEGATDHYVWALMRTRGVPERKITGNAGNHEKWRALAEIVPELAGNPTYEWLHLDLKRRFGIEAPVSAETADEIWTETEAQLQEPEMRPRALLREMNVEALCSTDDPASELDRHRQLAEELDGITVRPTWRPDRAMGVGRDGWREYVDDLGAATGTDVGDLDGFAEALERSHAYFDEHGCGASDHGLAEPVTNPVDEERARDVYDRARAGEPLSPEDERDFAAWTLDLVGELDAETDWVTQLHVGAVRDYRESLRETIGSDAGGDVSTGNVDYADGLNHFLNRFDGELEVVLYCVDPTHYPTVATIARAFPTVSVGAAWWFNDSPFGIQDQLEYVGTVDVLSNYAGMVSDSRKLVSFGSRFELFRRSLANAVGAMVERGQMPEDVAVDLVERVAYDRPAELWGF